MADMDAVIRKHLDDIWEEYDKDGSGALDKAETKKLVNNKFKNILVDEAYTDEGFEQCFKEFDKNGSGTIEKEEMALFLRGYFGV
jgi:Ca2+-binding EF-hand superfamily protein